MKKGLLFNQFPCLECDDVVLKKVEPCDAEDLYEILASENVYKYAPGKPSKTLAAVRNVVGHYERDFNKHKAVYLGIYLKAEGKLVGEACIFGFDDKACRCEIGYMLNENYWGRGIATMATKLMVDFLFSKIGANSVQASVMPVNKKSKNVLERCGFIHEGTLRQIKHWTGQGIVDLDMYSILKAEY